MKSILIFVDWFEPGYKGGGPIRSIAGFVDVFKDKFKIYIVTNDKDLNSKQSYDNIQSNTWLELHENVKVIYLSKPIRFLNFKFLINKFEIDWIYFNSLFSFKFSFLPYIYTKFLNESKYDILLAPRGELNPERLNIKSFKKKLFIKIIKLFGFYNDINWHATAIEEKNNIEKIFPNSNYLVSSNLSKVSIPRVKLEKDVNSLKIVFISRIVVYKNLHYAIELVNKMKNKENVIFDIYGPIEDEGYYNLCVNKADESEVKINFMGELKHTEVKNTLKEYDVFLFPTLGENYGHVIAEALICGCFVLISDQTPWNDLEEFGAGWSIPLSNISVFVDKLNYFYEMNQESYKHKKNFVLNYSKTKINSQESINKYITFLNN